MVDDHASPDIQYGFAPRDEPNGLQAEPGAMPQGWRRADGEGAAPLASVGPVPKAEIEEQKLWLALGLAGFVYLIGLISSLSFHLRLDSVP
jgi:hypothetical protein